jgi:hypothetical protein
MARIVAHNSQKIHRPDHAPMTTEMGMFTLEDCP